MAEAPDERIPSGRHDVEAALENTVIGTWSERDRSHVCLSWADGERNAGSTIVEWWDGSVDEAVEDGVLSRRDLHGSAVAYAAANGLLELGASPRTIAPPKVGFVASHPEKGLYLGWLKGGAACWSSESSQDRLDEGAYVFDSERSIDELFAGDAENLRASLGEAGSGAEASALADAGLDGTHRAHEVDLGIPSTSNATRSRVSVDDCLRAGVTLPDPAPGPSP